MGYKEDASPFIKEWYMEFKVKDVTTSSGVYLGTDYTQGVAHCRNKLIQLAEGVFPSNTRYEIRMVPLKSSDRFGVYLRSTDCAAFRMDLQQRTGECRMPEFCIQHNPDWWLEPHTVHDYTILFMGVTKQEGRDDELQEDSG